MYFTGSFNIYLAIWFKRGNWFDIRPAYTLSVLSQC